ncbi:hypothetical protein TNCV_4878471 [Trichonephila clavipes]|nr:hypothetical protein TNCV_4878471 [Trichonephila clavipes]
MVCKRISVGGLTDHHVFRPSSVTAFIYRDVILDPYAHPHLAAMGPDALFIDDNARIKQYLYTSPGEENQSQRQPSIPHNYTGLRARST